MPHLLRDRRIQARQACHTARRPRGLAVSVHCSRQGARPAMDLGRQRARIPRGGSQRPAAKPAATGGFGPDIGKAGPETHRPPLSLHRHPVQRPQDLPGPSARQPHPPRRRHRRDRRHSGARHGRRRQNPSRRGVCLGAPRRLHRPVPAGRRDPGQTAHRPRCPGGPASPARRRGTRGSRAVRSRCWTGSTPIPPGC